MVLLPLTAGDHKGVSSSCKSTRESIISLHLNAPLALVIKIKGRGNDNTFEFNAYLCKGHQNLRQCYTNSHIGTSTIRPRKGHKLTAHD